LEITAQIQQVNGSRQVVDIFVNVIFTIFHTPSGNFWRAMSARLSSDTATASGGQGLLAPIEGEKLGDRPHLIRRQADCSDAKHPTPSNILQRRCHDALPI
jgi:hypothetical protein